MSKYKTKKNIFEPSNPDLNKPPEEDWDKEPVRNLPFNVHAKQCSATSKATGTRCLNAAVEGYKVCRLHGANPKNPGGVSQGSYILNDFAMKSGAYACRFMEESERLSFTVFVETLLSQLGDWNIADLALAQTAGLIHIRITRAITQTDEATANPRAIEDLSKSMNRMLKALGITREGQVPKSKEEKTFAELALEMIEKARLGDSAGDGAKHTTPHSPKQSKSEQVKVKSEQVKVGSGEVETRPDQVEDPVESCSDMSESVFD